MKSVTASSFKMYFRRYRSPFVERGLAFQPGEKSFQYSHLCGRRVHCPGLMTGKPRVSHQWTSSKGHPTAGACKLRSKQYQCSSPWPCFGFSPNQGQPVHIHTQHCSLGGPRNEPCTTSNGLALWGKWPGSSLLTTGLERARSPPPGKIWARCTTALWHR